MYKVDISKCNGCGNCVKECPYGAIEILNNGRAEIDIDKCKVCGRCVHVCQMNAISEN